jgi:hypothetical protein
MRVGNVRETVSSLRSYFFLVGILGAVSNFLGVFKQQSAVAIGAAAVGLVVAAVFVYLAVAFKSLIVSAPGRIQQLIVAGVGLILVSAALNAVSNVTIAAAQAVGAVLIGAYLIFNVRRLAADAAKTASSGPVA